MDFNLSDERKLIAETARELAEREILPRVRENDRAERFDRKLARKLADPEIDHRPAATGINPMAPLVEA